MLGKADAIVRAETRRLAAGAAAATAAAPPLSVKVWTRYNPAGRSALFIVPGLAAYILAITAVLLTALTVAGEWERGSMEQLFASPVGRLEIVLGKLAALPRARPGVSSCWWWPSAPPSSTCRCWGSPALLLLIGFFFLVGMLGQGLLVSVLAKNQLVATQAGLLSRHAPVAAALGAGLPRREHAHAAPAPLPPRPRPLHGARPAETSC